MYVWMCVTSFIFLCYNFKKVLNAMIQLRDQGVAVVPWAWSAMEKFASQALAAAIVPVICK